MSNKLKYIIFFGAIFGLLGFAHSYIQFDGWAISIRDKETPLVSGIAGWLIICTGVFHFAHEAWKAVQLRHTDSIMKDIFDSNEANLTIGLALIFTVLQHAFLCVQTDKFEIAVSILFFCLFYYGLGKAVDG